MSINVILADDHQLIRDGIKALLVNNAYDINVLGTAVNGEELLKMADKTEADVYIVDIVMPGIDGLKAVQKLLKSRPERKVIFFSIHDEKDFVEKAIECGAKGYVLKETGIDEIINAIHEVYLGRFYLSPKISKYIVAGYIKNR
jgi:two-component system, NarL family, response regulator NreC